MGVEMTWNFNMDEAPRGRVVEEETQLNNGKTVKRTKFVADLIWAASSCGMFTKSYWVPSENGCGRWNMFTAVSPPIAWQPYVIPEHPEASQ